MVTISQIEKKKKNSMLSTHAMDFRNDLNYLQEFLVGYFQPNIDEGNNGFLSLLLAQGNKTSVSQLLFG